MMYTLTSLKSLPVFLLGALLMLAACGHGNGQGLDSSGNLITDSTDTAASSGGDNGGDTGGAAGASGNPDARLAWVQSNVFGGVCSQCHTGASAPLGLNWSSESNTCTNVDRPSGEKPEMMEIKSGFPDESYLIWKLEGAGPNGEAIVFEQMPAGGNPALSADTIQNMRDWISDGTPGCNAPKPSGSDDAPAGHDDMSASVRPEGQAVNTPGSWKEVWNESLRVCTLCHSANPLSTACSTEFDCPPAGIVLTEDNYFGLIDGNTVVPFDLESSSLWRRVTEADHETRMPLGIDPLTQAQIEVIRHWIEDGAPFCPEGQVCQ